MNNFYFENKLIYEKSPYLLQYAYNPINWFPWGKEAFSLAQNQNKPIFLSIGNLPSFNYKIPETVFQKQEIIELMNLNFINIKMDGEEYPYLANLYLDLSKILSSGFLSNDICSLNIILTPELLPFFSVHHLPDEHNYNVYNISHILNKIISLWENTQFRNHMITQSQKIIDILSLIDHNLEDTTNSLDLDDFMPLIYKEIDLVNGGVKSSPKKLNVNLLRFLLNFSIEYSDSKSLFFVNRSLDNMSRSVIFDHIKGGFYKCSIDSNWLFPSLEKISTENASLSLLLLEMYSLTKVEDYKETALLTLNYLIKELRDPTTHLFYLSENLENTSLENKDNLCFLCSYDEIQILFKKNEADLFCDYFGIYREGIFNGRNMLKRPSHHDEILLAKKYDLHPSKLKEKIQKLLFLFRKTKENNTCNITKNTQNLVYVNGFISHSLIQVGILLGDNKYIDISEKIMFSIKKNILKNGFLSRTFREDKNIILACLEDYATVILASISLFEAGRGKQWLNFACSLMDIVQTHFKSKNGSFYSNHDEDPYVILRRCNFIDTSIPSDNSLMAEVLLKFYYLFDDKKFLDEAKLILKNSEIQMKTNIVSSSSYLNILYKLKINSLFKIVILLDNNQKYKSELESMFLHLYLPNKVVIWIEKEDMKHTKLFPKKLNLNLFKNKTTIFVLEKEKTSRFFDPNSLRKYLCSL